MLKFKCPNCGKLIEDICGEHIDFDENDNLTYISCPYCGLSEYKDKVQLKLIQDKLNDQE